MANTFGPLSPLRPSDLIHTRNAIQEHAEKLIALARLELGRVEPATAWDGFVLRLPPVCPRVEEWWASRPDKKKHLWLCSLELDSFATHVLLANPIADKCDGVYAAICGWRDLQEAAADLRLRCLGPALMTSYGGAIFPSTASEIVRQFQLPERPLNSTAVPCWCRLKWGGYLLRFGRSGVGPVLDYFNITQPEDISLPILFTLGANLDIVLAFSSSAEEALRITLCCQWQAGLAIDDLGALLRSFPASKGSKTDRILKWIAPACFSSGGSRALEEEATPVAN
jgi:hypothetical protein